MNDRAGELNSWPGRLVHTGQVIIDLVMPVDTLPAPGGDVLARDARLWTGGGFNVMAAAARSGAHVVYAGAHGTGRFGDQAREALRAEGIAVVQKPVAELDTGVCVVLVDDSGERTFVTGTGAEGRLQPEQLAGVDTAPEDLVYVSGYSLMHESNRVALLAWLPGVRGRVLFDPGPLTGQIDPKVLDAVLSRTDLLSCNAAEAHTLSGHGDPEAAAAVLVERIGSAGVTTQPTVTNQSGSARGRHCGPDVVVRDGAAGCVLASDGKAEVVHGFPVDPVDTNGAGDTHFGVLAAALLSGADLRSAAVRANAAASLSVRRCGPATAPVAAQIDRFLTEG